jgi:acyl transferase domain-containing protein/acyl-CoA synthetase (AMP-forming)/AMP-acid ligase II/acyl carrier protein
MNSIQHTSKTLVELLSKRAELQPEKTAFIFLEEGEREGGSFTYKELDLRARSIAAKLQSLNLKGERALLIYESGLEYLDSFFGCLYAGVISVPLHLPGKNKSLSRISAIAKDSDAKVILSTREISGELKNEFVKDEVLKNLQWIETELIKNTESENFKEAGITSDTLAYLQYTSGSTGIPKGVMVNHENLLTNLEIIDKSHPHNDKSVMVTWLPIHHDMGLIYGILLPYYCGYPCYFMTPQAFVQKPFRWLKAISKYRGTHNAAPNFAFELCVNKTSVEQKKTIDLSSWTTAMNAAEPVRAETLIRFADYFSECGFKLKNFSPGYGLAEGTLILSTTFTDSEPVLKRFDDRSIEKNNIAAAAKADDTISKIHAGHSNSIEDTRIAIVNPVTLLECGEGEIGEVWASGKSIAQGYWMREDATKETFRAHIADTNEGPFLRTGDLGFISDNELYITGRHKDLIIIRGQNHYPQDIEYTVEASHQAFRLGCVAAFSFEENGEEHLGIVQEIQKNFAEEFKAEEAVKAIRKAVSEEHDLQVYSITLIKPGTVPKTSSGKIQRKACKAGVEENNLEVIVKWNHNGLKDFRIADNQVNATLEKTEESKNSLQIKFNLTKSNLCEWLAVRISEMMQIKKDSIDLNEPFAVYGMDSLKAVQLSGDLETLLERELPSALVYDYPNINSLAGFLSADSSESEIKTDSKEKSEGKIKSNEPVAIIGIGLRFPEANDVNEFWNNLISGKDSIRQIPDGRWDKNSLNNSTVTYGGFVDDTDKFDPVFFGISPREAVQIDPQQRFALEVAWQALEDAGINPIELAGTDAGVFMGICTYDYARYSSGRKELFDVYTGTGTSLSIAANRLSYFFDFRGPSISIDTACSSSLVALHTACESLRSGQSTIALAGGVNLLLAPDWNIVFTEADMLAPDGKCKTFDKDADGYVRSEGCGIVVLKKLSDAQRDGDRIYSVIMGSAINQDGRSNGLTAPNGPSQVAVIKKALDNADVKPNEINYLETHGTGTPLGDPIEVNSLSEALSKGRKKDETLWIGSVKTNIGHLEAAAGIAGVIKTSLALFKKEIPKHLNFNNLNPEIHTKETNVKVADKNIEWKEDKRLAGVSSFGFGGTNAHIILQNAPEEVSKNLKSKPYSLLTLSAKSENVLNELLNKYEKFLDGDSQIKSEDICYSSNRRAAHNHRLAIVCSDTDDLKKEILNYRKRKDSFDIIRGTVKINHTPKIAFLFPGQGAQYIGMGKELYDTHPLFRKTINRCDEILRNYLEKSLLEVLFYEKDETANPINETMYTQPALFAVEYALAQLWMSWGIKPSLMMGHSAGEYIAACLAGVFSLEDGLKLVTERGRLMETLTSNGEMYTIFADELTAKNAVRGFEDSVSVASINSPFKTVISGNRDSLAKILPKFDKEQIEYKKINVSIASHSPLMETMIEEFRKVCNTVKYSSPNIPVVSNITGEVVTGRISNADYWCEHIMSSVRFSESIIACVKYGCDTFIDLGPKPTSIGMAQETVMDSGINWLPSFKKNFTAWETMLQGLGKLFAAGAEPDWNNFDREFSHKLISLPNYPFQKQRYWISEAKGSKSNSFTNNIISKENQINDLAGSELITASSKEYIFNSQISSENPSYLKDHCVFGKAVLPGAAYAEIALSAVRKIPDTNASEITDLKFHQAMIFEKDEAVNIQTIFERKEKNKFSFQIYSSAAENNTSWILHASGNISSLKSAIKIINVSAIRDEYKNKISAEKFYADALKSGVDYKKDFQALKDIFIKENSALGYIENDRKSAENNYTIHPVILDAAFQTVLAILLQNKADRAFIPVRVDKIEMHDNCPEIIYSHVKLKKESGNISGVHKADIQIISPEGKIIASVTGLTLKEVSREEFFPAEDKLNEWFYEVNWVGQSIQAGTGISDYIPSLKLLKETADISLHESLKEHSLKEYHKGTDRLNEISISFIIKSFEELGLSFEKGNTFSPETLNISKQHNKLLKRFIDILSDKGIIKAKDGLYNFHKTYNTENISEQLKSFQNEFPQLKAEYELVKTCGPKLSQVLTGKCDPLQLLFPNGDLSPATALYQDSPAFAAMNQAVKEIVKVAANELKNGNELRIIELGAGTGSTASYIFPELKSKKVKYTFTDISAAFFAKAKERFSEFDFTEYKTLDIERDTESQGFAEHSYDIVIASNVIHATKDLKVSCQNIQKLLKSNGLLILNEVTEKNSWIDITFGLTDGWWRFEDKNLRTDYPLLSNRKWKEFLKDAGFGDSKISIPEKSKDTSLTSQSIILAEAPGKSEDSESGRHIIFFADSKSSKSISKYFKTDRQKYTLIINSDKKKHDKLSVNEYEIDFSDKGNITKVMKEVSGVSGEKVTIVYMNSHKGQFKEEDADKHSAECCINAVNILQSVQSAGFKNSPSLFIVTHDSQKIIEDDNLKGLAYSSLWGLAKVISMEHPEYKCRRIDIDSKDDFEILMKEIISDSEEEQVAFRGGKRFVSRLRRSIIPKGISELKIDSKGMYLITGGLGGLGILTAEFLSRRGAKHIMLTGRRENTKESEEILSEIRKSGTEVRVVKADISSKEDADRLFREIKSVGIPLKGIVHSAGVLDDGVILNQDKNKFSKVMSPKVKGAWYLHEHSKKSNLDFFVMYSSVASLLGSAGQSNHSSANAFLDAFAHYRNSKGLPSLSINWGVWSEIGSASAKGADKKEKISGMGVITPEKGINALERVMVSGKVQTGIVPINWSKFSAGYRGKFISELIKSDSESEINHNEISGSGDFLSAMADAPDELHSEMLVKYFKKVISGIMGTEQDELDAGQPLNTIGLDSLMAIELKNKVNIELGVDLNLVRYMEETNIEQLADELKDQLKNILKNKTDFKTRLINSPSESHSQMLTQYFRDVISGIMGLEPEDLDVKQALNTVGLDSLMAIELKNKVNMELGVDLNLVRYMEETNIEQLAEELMEQLPKIINGRENFITRLKNAPAEKHTEMLVQYFKNVISGIMGLEQDDLDIEQPLNTVGLDSLMAIELKNKVNMELGVDLNLVRYMEETNIIKLAEELKEQLPKITDREISAAVSDRDKNKISEEEKTRDLLSNLDNLSEEELEKLLKEMN